MRSKCKLFLDSDDDDNVGSGSFLSPIITSEKVPTSLSTSKRKRKLRELSEYSSDEEEQISPLQQQDRLIFDNVGFESIPAVSQEISKAQTDIAKPVLPEKIVENNFHPQCLIKPMTTVQGRVCRSHTINQCSNEDDSYLPRFAADFNQPDCPLTLQAVRNINKSQGLSMQAEVNHFAARCLFDHQVTGVKWLWEKYAQRKGAILG